MENVATAQAVERDELIVAELHRLGVTHLARLSVVTSQQDWEPKDLLAALASHSEARFQASLILLFLRRPEYGHAVGDALATLDSRTSTSLKLYYQAAAYLQRELAPELSTRLSNWEPLNDLFSQALGLPAAASIGPGHQTANKALQQLGALHAKHSGWNVNWAGAYLQNIPLLLRHLPQPAGERPHA